MWLVWKQEMGSLNLNFNLQACFIRKTFNSKRIVWHSQPKFFAHILAGLLYGHCPLVILIHRCQCFEREVNDDSSLLVYFPAFLGSSGFLLPLHLFTPRMTFIPLPFQAEVTMMLNTLEPTCKVHGYKGLLACKVSFWLFQILDSHISQ